MPEEHKDSIIKEKYKQQRDILISNTVRLLGFILLAIVFDRWWIVLLSVLFWTYTKGKD